ncbi:MAG TPA: hypothetical protein VF518_06490 [Polyangia bacterium]
MPQSSRPCWYLVYDTNSVSGCPNTYLGQKISALRKTGQVAPAGTLLSMKCLTCAQTGGCASQ